MTTRHSYTKILMIGLIAAFAAFALPTTTAFVVDPGGEPGAGCFDVTGDTFEVLDNVPFQGIATLDLVGKTYVGTAVQHGQSTCMMNVVGGQDFGVSQCKDLKPSDIIGYCLNATVTLSGGACTFESEFAEVLAAGRVMGGEGTTCTVQVQLLGLGQE